MSRQCLPGSSARSKLLGHASISITADAHGLLIGTIAQEAVDGAAYLIAHTVHTYQEWMPDAGFALSGERASD